MGDESTRRQSKNLLPGTILVMTTHPEIRNNFWQTLYVKIGQRTLFNPIDLDNLIKASTAEPRKPRGR